MKKNFQKWFPPLLMVVMALWFFGQLQPPKDKDFAFSKFGKLPLVFDGRLKPLDSLARNSLLQIRQTQTVDLEPWKSWNENPKIISATEWLANVMMNPQVADAWPVFRVDNPDLITAMKLPEKNEAQHQDGKHYSWNQIAPSFDLLNTNYARVQKIEQSERNAFDRGVSKVFERLMLYEKLQSTVEPASAQDWKSELAGYENLVPAGVAAVRAQQAGQKYDQAVFNEFTADLQSFDDMSRLDAPLVVPPQNPSGNWQRMGDALMNAAKGRKVSPAVEDYAAMADALKAGDAAGFNSALADYRASLVPDFSSALARARAEVFFNQMQPFYNAMVIYVLAGLLAIFSWFNLSETLRRSAVWLIVLA
ncbi:MAG TPA: cytochrome C biogenesis protein, partial [Verrucomicrobiae bacterium]|nr:cytochrome C biogenesis protein [Verrucomicrobiae bacterium]